MNSNDATIYYEYDTQIISKLICDVIRLFKI